MRKFILQLFMCLVSFNAYASYPPTISAPNNPIFTFYSPDVKEDFTGPYCEDGDYIVNGDTNLMYRMSNCATTPVYTQVFPILPAQMDIAAFMQTLMASPNLGSLKSSMFTGLSSDCVKADGSSGACSTGGVSLPIAETDVSNLTTDLSAKALKTITVNGHALSSNVTVTASDVSLGNVVNADTTTTANITDSTNKRFVTNAQLVVVGNTSGTNTGDQTTVSGNAGTATKLATARTIAITGDLSYTSPSFDGSSNVTAAGTLANSGVTAGTYKNVTLDVDAKGRITTAASGTRTFNYPSRTLASCFQVSSTQDADVNYSVDVTATLTLGGGTGVITSYTNSGCTTGAQTLINGSVSSVALLGTSSILLHAMAKANTWLKITATASGGGSASIDSVQSETLLP